MADDATNPWNPPNPDDQRETGATPPAADPVSQSPQQPSPPAGQPPAGYPGYPGAPSQPLYGYPGGPPDAGAPPPGYPGSPSQPAYGPPGYPTYLGYPGYPAAPSQPLSGGPQTVPPWGPPSQALAGSAPPKRKSRRGLWIALGVVAALLLAGGGGGAFAFVQYLSPATTAGTFCGELKARNYAAAYEMLGTGLHAQLTDQAFAQDAATLDAAEGDITSCTQAPIANAYNYSLVQPGRQHRPDHAGPPA